ncbi:MAG: hypothetical protein Q4P15_06970 [Propionibacteriaceae bacterium]|nr:hypothetical protein [Propionibacteriaceae bacterium]
MQHEEDAGVDVEIAVHGATLRVVFPDGAWTIALPDGWSPQSSDEHDLWRWELTGVAQARVRLRRRPHIQLELDVVNQSDDVVVLEAPVVSLLSEGTQVPWFAGAAGEVLHVSPASSVLWVQLRGSCAGEGRAFSVVPEPLSLRPGQGSSAAWRRRELPIATLVPEPAWVPRQRYFRRGESLEVFHTDAALMGLGLEITATVDGSSVEGRPGLHDLAFLDARGTALVEVGWFDPLEDIVASCLALPGLDPNLMAWLFASTDVDEPTLDALDVALGEALEAPTFWGVLAGMRAVTLTDLPVASEVVRAARAVWRDDLDPHARRLLLTHGLLSGWEPPLVGEWLHSAGPIPFTDAQTVLASVGHGRVTSAPVVHGGMDVALAGMWLAAQPESAAAAEWERAVAVSRSRLMCALSQAPNAVDVAWLVVEGLLG